MAEYFNFNSLPLATRMYRLQAMPKMSAKSSNVGNLYDLLINFDFIESKVSAFGSQALIEDYDLAFNPDVLFSGEKAETLRLIQGAIRLSAHILEADEIWWLALEFPERKALIEQEKQTKLIEQLWGRLVGFKLPEIQALLEQAKQKKNTPWLRPLAFSLTPPGGRLLRTLTSYSGLQPREVQA